MRVHLSLFCVFFIAGCATVTPKSCEITDIHFSRDAPIKVGDGLVSYYNSPAVFSSGSFAYIDRTVIDCATGEELRIVYVADDSPGTPDGVYAGNAGMAFEKGFSSASFQSLAEVKVAAKAAGLTTTSRILDREDCGCAAFAPELRGGKKAYDPDY